MSEPDAAPAGLDTLTDGPRPRPPSVFAVLHRGTGASWPATKRLLVGVSHAIEDECRADPGQAHVFGCFQRPEFYEPARTAWRRLAGVTRSAYVFADFDASRPGRGRSRPAEVALDRAHPMRREWVLVVDRPRGPLALAAREQPGQDGVPDAERVFDTAFTTDPATVRRAARVCAVTAVAAGIRGAAALAYALSIPPVESHPDTSLEARILRMFRAT
jgi:hypothetical protein